MRDELPRKQCLATKGVGLYCREPVQPSKKGVEVTSALYSPDPRRGTPQTPAPRRQSRHRRSGNACDGRKVWRGRLSHAGSRSASRARRLCPRGKYVPKKAGAQRYPLPRALSGHTISCHRGLEPRSVQHRFPVTEFRRFGSRVHQPGR